MACEQHLSLAKTDPHCGSWQTKQQTCFSRSSVTNIETGNPIRWPQSPPRDSLIEEKTATLFTLATNADQKFGWFTMREVAMMRSTLILLCVYTLAVSAGSIDGLLKYNVRAPMPTAFVHPFGKRQNIEACSEVYSAFTSCERNNPGVLTGGLDDLASCLCYEGTSWRPSAFDGQVMTCANFAKTVDPDSYSSINYLNGFCTSVGDVRGGGSVGPVSTTSRTSSGSGGGSGTGPRACSIASSVVSFCNSVSPGFTIMPVSDQAPCLCYDSTSWAPDLFDGVVQTCINYVSTALPSLYSDIVLLQDFCTSAGDVLGPATNSASTTAQSTSSRSQVTSSMSSGTLTTTSRPTGVRPASVTPTGIVAYPPCSYLSATIEYCNSISPGYTSMEPSSQVPCVCYTSSTWSPDRFDRSASSCADFVKTEQPQDYSAFSALAGFCTDVGDVFAQTTRSRGSSASGGIGGLPGDMLSGSSPTPSSTTQTTSTVTVRVPASAAATTSSANAGVRGVFANHWAEKLVVVFMVVLV